MSGNDLPCRKCKTNHHPAEDCQVSAFDKQEDGNHYKTMGIQPLELIYVRHGYVPFWGSCLVKIDKYIHRDKNDYLSQLKKARHVLDMLIEKTEQEGITKIPAQNKVE